MDADRVRLYLIWLAAIAGVFGGAALRAGVMDSQFVVRTLGPTAAYSASEALYIFFAVIGLGTAVRLSAQRHTVFRALEALALGAFLVSPLAPHRDGRLNRPFEMVDYAWSRNWNPISVFSIYGVAVSVAVGIWLALTSREKRFWTFPFLLLVLAGCTALFSQFSRGRYTFPGAGNNPARSSQSLQDSMADPDAPLSNAPAKPVAIVVFHEDESLPADESYYFRQSVMSRFNGRRLVHDLSSIADPDVPDALPASRLQLAETNTGLLRTTVSQLEQVSRPLLLVNPAAVQPSRNPDERLFHTRSYYWNVSVFEICTLDEANV